MPLKISLKPHERVYIGPAVIINGPNRAQLLLMNRVPVVRDRDIIEEEEADTVAKKLYLTILRMYLNPQEEKRFHDVYFLLLKQLIAMPLEAQSVDVMVEMSKKIITDDHYRALKMCRRLIEMEKEVLSNEQRADQGL